MHVYPVFVRGISTCIHTHTHSSWREYPGEKLGNPGSGIYAHFDLLTPACRNISYIEQYHDCSIYLKGRPVIWRSQENNILRARLSRV